MADAPLVVYDTDRQGQGDAPSEEAIADAQRRWEAKYKDGARSVSLNEILNGKVK